MRPIIVFLLLFCLVAPAAHAQLYSDVGDYSFIFALAGSAIERQMRALDGTIIPGANGCDQIVIERARIDGFASPGYQMRIISDMTVTTLVDSVVITTPAMAVFDAQLSLNTTTESAMLQVSVAPETIAVSGDLPFDDPAEWTVYNLREQIADTLSIAVPLGLVTQLITTIPDQANIYINAYQQGFIYVVQIYAPSVSPAPLPPHIFRTGNAFTLSLSEPVVEAMIRRALRENESFTSFGETGFPADAGTIRVTDISVDLCYGNMLVTYSGTDAAGKSRTISWLMDFRRGRYDVDIQVIQVNVDGVKQTVPAEDEYINPVSQAFFGFVRLPEQGTEIIVGTLGLTSITYGEIRPNAIIIAGRQW